MTPRVVIADATPFLRFAVREALTADGIAVQAEVDAAADALAAVVALAPDILLIDVELDPQMKVVRRVVEAAPGVCVLILAPDACETTMLAAVRAGACGFVPKETAPERLSAIVRGAFLGEAAIPRRLVRTLLAEMRETQGTAEDHGLSVRERQVLDLLAAGLDDGAVAARLDIVEVTVRRHAASAARKLGAHDRAQAVSAYLSPPASRAALGRPAA